MSTIDLDTILKQVPLLADIPAQDLLATPLPGLTNLNFHLRHQANDYVLRVPGKYTSRFIDREKEAFNTDLAIGLKLAPKILWRDASGLSLTQSVSRSRNLVKDDFHDDNVLKSLIDKLKVLHGSGLSFKGQTDIDGLLSDHFNLMPANRQNQLSGSFEKALSISRRVTETDSRLVASHNDLVLDNLLLDEKQMLWLIDWEYSSLSSPYWDIATLCNNARLDQQQCRHLLSLYNNSTNRLRLESLCGYQYILQLLTICWLAAYTGEPIEAEIDWLARLESLVNQN